MRWVLYDFIHVYNLSLDRRCFSLLQWEADAKQ